METEVIEVVDIPEVWPSVKSFFQKVIDLNPGYATIEGIYNRLKHGESILVLVKDNETTVAALSCEVIVCDTGAMVLMIPHLSGVRLDEWMGDVIADLYDLGAKLGCFRLMIAGGRPGWVKTMKQYGGEVAHVTIEFDVADWFKT